MKNGNKFLFLFDEKRMLIHSFLHSTILIFLVFITLLIARRYDSVASFLKTLDLIFKSTSIYYPITIGVAIVISCGEIDLSISGGFAFYSMLLLFLSNFKWDPIIVYSIVLFFSLLIGFLMGFLIIRLRVPSLIVTLGGSYVLYGIAFLINFILINGGKSFSLEKKYLIPMFQCSWLWALLLIIFLFFIKYFTLHWNQHLSTGIDNNAAQLAALPVFRVKIFAYIMSSILCFLSSILMFIGFNNGGWDIGTGKGIELIAIATAVIGGTRISGGKLNPINVGLAAALWQSFKYLSDINQDVKPQTQELALGLFLIIVAVFSSKNFMNK